MPYFCNQATYFSIYRVGVLLSYFRLKTLFFTFSERDFSTFNFEIIKIRPHVMNSRKCLNEALYKNKFENSKFYCLLISSLNDLRNCRAKDVLKKSD